MCRRGGGILLFWGEVPIGTFGAGASELRARAGASNNRAAYPKSREVLEAQCM